MVVRSIYICLFLFLSSTLVAQDQSFDFGFASHHRLFTNELKWDSGKNGASLRCGYSTSLGKGMDLRLGAEIGAGGLANYTGLEVGLVRQEDLLDGPLVLKYGVHVLQGLALFTGGGMYMYGFSEENFLGCKTRKGNVIGLSLSFRFYSFPGYKAYSDINSFGDIQYGLRYYF